MLQLHTQAAKLKQCNAVWQRCGQMDGTEFTMSTVVTKIVLHIITLPTLGLTMVGTHLLERVRVRVDEYHSNLSN